MVITIFLSSCIPTYNEKSNKKGLLPLIVGACAASCTKSEDKTEGKLSISTGDVDVKASITYKDKKEPES